MQRIKIEVASPPDREKLVANLMVDGEQLAEITQEQPGLTIEHYGRRDGQPWELALADLVAALAAAKSKLEERS